MKKWLKITKKKVIACLWSHSPWGASRETIQRETSLSKEEVRNGLRKALDEKLIHVEADGIKYGLSDKAYDERNKKDSEVKNLIIKIEYKSGTVDEYPIDRRNVAKKVKQFLKNTNITTITLKS